MSIANDIKRDIKEAKKIRLPWWAEVCLIVGSVPIFFLFDHFGKFDIALPTLVSIGMLGFVIRVKWQLRRHAWFWGTMIVLAALHASLISFVAWTTNWVPAAVTGAIGSVDVIVMLAILAVVAKSMAGPNAADR
jgi:hypothetical protein